MKKNILIIPHAPMYKNIFNRGHELAINLDKNKFNVYFLVWNTCFNCSILDKIKTQIKNLYTKNIIEKKINYIRVPMLNFPKTANTTLRFNSVMINKFIQKYNIDILINSNINYFDFKYIDVETKIFDVVDDHLSKENNIGINEDSIKLQIKNMQNSDKIIVITNQIKNKVINVGIDKEKIEILENGFYPNIFDEIDENTIFNLKKELNLENKKIVGYIGNIDEWVRLELALEAFVSRYKDSDKVCFLVVGGSMDKKYFETIKQKYNYSNIKFMGYVKKEEVYKYFKLLDIGIIPFELSDFTNNAFPIKTLEYGYAGAKVISSKLDFLVERNFSFVEFFDDIDDLASKMNFDNDKLNNKEELKKYSWQELSKKLGDFIDN